MGKATPEPLTVLREGTSGRRMAKAIKEERIIPFWEQGRRPPTTTQTPSRGQQEVR